MKNVSKSNRFICDTTDILKDGCPVQLNPEFYGNHMADRQVGFITNEFEFFLDTNGAQVKMEKNELSDLCAFVDSLFESQMV